MTYRYRGLVEFSKAALGTDEQAAMMKAMGQPNSNGLLQRCWYPESTQHPTRAHVEAIAQHLKIAPAVIFIDCYEVKPRDVPGILQALRRQVSLSVIQKAVEDLK